MAKIISASKIRSGGRESPVSTYFHLSNGKSAFARILDSHNEHIMGLDVRLEVLPVSCHLGSELQIVHWPLNQTGEQKRRIPMRSQAEFVLEWTCLNFSWGLDCNEILVQTSQPLIYRISRSRLPEEIPRVALHARHSYGPESTEKWRGKVTLTTRSMRALSLAHLSAGTSRKIVPRRPAQAINGLRQP